MDTVHRRVMDLCAWLIEELLALRHPGGRPLVRLYGPACTDLRGATLALNLYDADGRVVDHPLVEKSAGDRGISLRTGCFCNPGAGEVALGLTREEIEACFPEGETRMTYDDLRRCVDPHEAGAVRVSLGLVSAFADVYAFREWARTLLGQAATGGPR